MPKPEKLALAQGVFADWRKERKTKTEPIPESLWGLAISLLKYHSVAEVARTLRINGTTLKKKAEANPPQPSMTTPCKRAPESRSFSRPAWMPSPRWQGKPEASHPRGV